MHIKRKMFGTVVHTIKKRFAKHCLGLCSPVLLLCILFTLDSCDSENVSDCFQRTGPIVREEIVVPGFDRITVFENVSLVVKQGDSQNVEIETGNNLRNEVAAVVENGRLLLTDTNDCNYVRAYGTTVVYVTTPNLTEIRSSTGFPIQSDGKLIFDSLSLLSESFIDPAAVTTDGGFDLELNVKNLNITVNGIAYFKLRGQVETMNITIAAGDSRIESKDLIAQNVNLNHRGSNDILIYPVSSISGVIRGTGDVLSYNRPTDINVEQLFNGRLIFME